MKPMLACELTNLSDLKFPLYISPKLDGIRCLAVNGQAVSRTGKLIPNKYIQQFFKQSKLHGFDGELIVGDTFQSSSSGVMSIEGEPLFEYHVFDIWNANNATYHERKTMIEEELTELDENDLYVIKQVPQLLCHNEDNVHKFHNSFLKAGYEGSITRHIGSLYKQGRSTMKEQYLCKIKPSQDDEAIVVGFEEELDKDKQPNDTLGSLVVTHPVFGTFYIGTGFTDAQRTAIWNDSYAYIGALVKFKYQREGMKDKPRFPVFLGFRDAIDI
jgi:DNA ligase-1